MSQNPFDQGCRYLLGKLDSRGVIGWLLGLSAEAFHFEEWLDTRSVPFPDDPDRTSDAVAYLSNPLQGGVPWAIAHEFQIEPDPHIESRLGEYLFRIRRDKKPDPNRGSRFEIGAVLVNLTGIGKASFDSSWPEAGLRTTLSICERNLIEHDADAVLTEIEEGKTTRSVLPWVPLMKNGDDLGIITRWKEIAEVETNSAWRADYAALALVFAEASKCRDVWRDALKEWNMVESVQVKEWQQQAEARGEAKGRVEGRVENQIEAIGKILQTRFGSVPKEVTEKVGSVTDFATLDAWFIQAVQADSLDVFRQATGL